MSNNIPVDPNKQPPIIPQKESSQHPPSQIERSAITPSSSQRELDLEKMASSAKEEQKRRREKKGKELSLSVEKKRKIVQESKEKIAPLLEMVSECLGPFNQSLNNLESIANYCFEKIREKIQQPDYLRTIEILKIYQLLFETDLEPICTALLSQPLNSINPHPTHLFKSLYDCLKALEKFPSFRNACEAREEYLLSNPGLVSYLNYDLSTRNRILPLIAGKVPDFQEVINRCPVYTAKDFMGGDNIHTVYVLRGTDFDPKLIFKPTLEVTSPSELFPLNASDPPEISHKEHVAHLLNFHAQFPIPAVVQVEIKGYVGSIQPFIEKTLAISEAISSQLSVKDLQTILVYDLLFSNCDRHIDNLLAKKEGGVFHVLGIDHDSCMTFDNRPLKIDYLQFSHAFTRPFLNPIRSLVSEESVLKYKTMMIERNMPFQAVEWMEYAALCLRKACDDNKAASPIARKLIDEFRNRYVT